GPYLQLVWVTRPPHSPVSPHPMGWVKKNFTFPRSISAPKLLVSTYLYVITTKNNHRERETMNKSMVAPFRCFSNLAVASAAFILGGVIASAQTVTPTNIVTGPVICSGGNQTNTVQICLPTNATIDKVDVFLLMDDTGSFEAFVPTLTNIFAGLVGSLESALPGVSFGFGVGRF